jgi:hypothetical protein
VIALPTGIAPFVAGKDGGDTVGAISGGIETGGLRAADVGAGESETAESPEMSTGTWRAQAANTAPAMAPVPTANNPRLFIAVPSTGCTT